MQQKSIDECHVGDRAIVLGRVIAKAIYKDYTLLTIEEPNWNDRAANKDNQMRIMVTSDLEPMESAGVLAAGTVYPGRGDGFKILLAEIYISNVDSRKVNNAMIQKLQEMP